MSTYFSKEPLQVERVETKFRRIVTDLPPPQSIGILSDLEKYEPRSMQGQPPVVWEKAEGFQVHDRWGNCWIDLSSGVLVANVGHGNTDIKQAIVRQVEDGSMFSYCYPTEVRARLVRKLVEISPPRFNKAFLLTTGSEATENVIKLARTYGQKAGGADKVTIVSFERGFHGRTMGAQLAGGYPAAKEWIGRTDSTFVQVPFPDGFHCIDTGFNVFERTLEEKGLAGGNVAAVMMESYQGGGASFAPRAYVQALRKWCSKNNALLIFDEVQSGFARTGKLFAFEHYGVEPDLLCLGKAISGSLPLSAVLGTDDIMNLYGPGSMSSTHGGNPVCCAAALANLEVLEKGDYIGKADNLGKVLFSAMESIRKRYASVIAAVHGKGLVCGLHIVNEGTNQASKEIAFATVKNCFERGVLLFAPVGYGEATIKICPPLCITEAALGEAIEVLEESLSIAVKEQKGR